MSETEPEPIDIIMSAMVEKIRAQPQPSWPPPVHPDWGTQRDMHAGYSVPARLHRKVSAQDRWARHAARLELAAAPERDE